MSTGEVMEVFKKVTSIDFFKKRMLSDGNMAWKKRVKKEPVRKLSCCLEVVVVGAKVRG